MSLARWSKRLWPFGVIFAVTSVGIVLAPLIFPQWELADSARAYAYGHLQLGLWSAEQAQAIIEQSYRTQHSVRILGGCAGLYVGILTCLVLGILKSRRLSIRG